MMNKRDLQDITTEIISDYPGRFFLDETELRRLVTDMESLLANGKQKPKIRYWVSLENGILYETNDLNIILAEENSNKLTIRLLLIFAEIQDIEKKPLRRIIVHFSRGKRLKNHDNLHLGGEGFNTNFHGISYRILDRNRDATLKSITAVEERLSKFRRWYSTIPELPINFRSLSLLAFSSLGLGSLLYSLSAMQYIKSSWGGTLFEKTDFFLGGAALGSLIVVVAIAVIMGIYKFINWIIPPTVIAIGDEVKESKKQQSLREYIFWGVLVATMVGIFVNMLTR